MGELNESSTVQFEIESCCLARNALSMHASIASGLPHLGPNEKVRSVIADRSTQCEGIDFRKTPEVGRL